MTSKKDNGAYRPPYTVSDKAIALVGDISAAIEDYVVANGFSCVRDLVGHGIGREMHEDPSVYNFGIPGMGLRIRKGMTIAIEPMIVEGDWHVDVEDDGWFVRTRDRRLSSHYEHTVAIVDDQPPELLTYPGYVWKEEN